MATGLYYDPLFLTHETLGHIESIDRVASCLRLLEDSGVASRLERPLCRDATDEELSRIHRPAYVTAMRQIGATGPVMIGGDTIANTGTYAATVRAAGACLGAVEAVIQGDLENAFCLTRPPGHHAVEASPMGFCFFNSVAVAAAHARVALGVERVAIVDIDIHHGNGTQDAFYNDSSVLYISTHQSPYYPYTGAWDETGEGTGLGTTLNLPLPGGCGDVEYSHAFDTVILPKLLAFQPGLVLVSAGYDAHFADPIDGSMMQLSCAGYASLVSCIRDSAAELCGGRVVVALEGGYDLTALPWSVRNSMEVLRGEPITPDPLGAAPGSHSPDIEPLLARLREVHDIGA